MTEFGLFLVSFDTQTHAQTHTDKHTQKREKSFEDWKVPNVKCTMVWIWTAHVLRKTETPMSEVAPVPSLCPQTRRVPRTSRLVGHRVMCVAPARRRCCLVFYDSLHVFRGNSFVHGCRSVVCFTKQEFAMSGQRERRLRKCVNCLSRAKSHRTLEHVNVPRKRALQRPRACCRQRRRTEMSRHTDLLEFLRFWRQPRWRVVRTLVSDFLTQSRNRTGGAKWPLRPSDSVQIEKAKTWPNASSSPCVTQDRDLLPTQQQGSRLEFYGMWHIKGDRESGNPIDD